MSNAQQRIDELVKSNEVLLFMKGNASFPQCSFSGRAIQILKACGVETKAIKKLFGKVSNRVAVLFGMNFDTDELRLLQKPDSLFVGLFFARIDDDPAAQSWMQWKIPRRSFVAADGIVIQARHQGL